MTKTLRNPMFSSNSQKIKTSPSGATILGVPIYTLGGYRIRIHDNIYDLTPEKHKAFSSTLYTAKNMKTENDILMRNNIIRDLS